MFKKVISRIWPLLLKDQDQPNEALRPAVFIFSKNRAPQLEALLWSLAAYSELGTNVRVLFKALSIKHQKGYDILQSSYPSIKFIKETNFFKDVKALLKKSDENEIMFCTDDGIFFAPVPKLVKPEWNMIAGISLRLGKNCSYSHPANQEYPLPKFSKKQDLLTWKWKKGKGDFRVVYSLDAHIYPRRRILDLISLFEFQNPNQLEDQLNRFGNKTAPDWMICTEQSCYVSLPVNRVNTKFLNRAGLKYPAHEDYLIDKFLAGEKLDARNIVTALPLGPHQEFPLKWTHSKIAKD